MRIILNDCEPEVMEAADIAAHNGKWMEIGELLGVRTPDGAFYSLRRNAKSVSVWKS